MPVQTISEIVETREAHLLLQFQPMLEVNDRRLWLQDQPFGLKDGPSTLIRALVRSKNRLDPMSPYVLKEPLSYVDTMSVESPRKDDILIDPDNNRKGLHSGMQVTFGEIVEALRPLSARNWYDPHARYVFTRTSWDVCGKTLPKGKSVARFKIYRIVPDTT